MSVPDGYQPVPAGTQDRPCGCTTLAAPGRMAMILPCREHIDRVDLWLRVRGSRDRVESSADCHAIATGEPLYQFRFYQSEVDRIAWALEQRAGEVVTNDEARAALLGLASRFREALHAG